MVLDLVQLVVHLIQRRQGENASRRYVSQQNQVKSHVFIFRLINGNPKVDNTEADPDERNVLELALDVQLIYVDLPEAAL